jgi:serine/threonine protein phosphatase 1
MCHIKGLFAKKRTRPVVPEDVRVYAIGDIHGCLVELDALMAKIVEDAAGFDGERQLVFLGDYVDRGPDSRGVLDRLLALPEGFEPHYILGNHDQTLLDFLENPSLLRDWRDFGGRETLMSYGVTPPRFDNEMSYAQARDMLRSVMPPSHLDFLGSLKYFVTIGTYHFVHAGIRPGVALDRQAPEDLLWIRDEFLLSDVDHGVVVVHGHTPTEEPAKQSNRISVDTGAYATGRLTAAVLERTLCRFLSTK